jgi:hypothetical protein
MFTYIPIPSCTFPVILLTFTTIRIVAMSGRIVAIISIPIYTYIYAYIYA